MSAFEKTTFTDHGNVRVLHAPAELDVYTAPYLREASVDAVNDGIYRLVVDLSKTTYIDSTGLGVLVGIDKRAAKYGGWMRVVVSDPRGGAARALRISGLAKVFAIEGGVETALADREVTG
jgi:anti-sigma B factor antagonist